MKKALFALLLSLSFLLPLSACQAGSPPEPQNPGTVLGTQTDPAQDEYAGAETRGGADPLSTRQADSSPGPQDLEAVLKAQIDPAQDEYLDAEATADGVDPFELLRLDTVHYGGFTAPDKSELFAAFKVLGQPHAAGLDRTIAAVYDADSLELIAQRTFAADIVSFYFMPAWEGERVLFIGDVTYQGSTVYHAELYSLQDGSWTRQPMPREDSGDLLAYAMTNDTRLHVFTLTHGKYETIFEYNELFYWREDLGEFSREPF